MSSIIDALADKFLDGVPPKCKSILTELVSATADLAACKARVTMLEKFEAGSHEDLGLAQDALAQSTAIVKMIWEKLITEGGPELVMKIPAIAAYFAILL